MYDSLLGKYAKAYNWAYKNCVAILFLILVIVVTYFFTARHVNNKYKGCSKIGFRNKSPLGFYYDTNSLTFPMDSERKKAESEVIRYCASQGLTYTADDIAHISDSFIIIFLDPEDEVEQKALLAQLVMLVDPNYRPVYTMVLVGHRSGNVLKGDVERQRVFDMISKYFATFGTPITTPLPQWTDALLIRAFRTRQLPPASAFPVIAPTPISTVDSSIVQPIDSALADTKIAEITSTFIDRYF